MGLPEPVIHRLQDFKLRRTILQAYHQVPFYKDLLDAHGVHPEDIRGVDDLSRLPIIRKEDLKRVPLEQRIARGSDLKQCAKRSTSGSTGMPFDIYYSKEDMFIRGLASLRHVLWLGARLLGFTAGVTQQP